MVSFENANATAAVATGARDPQMPQSGPHAVALPCAEAQEPSAGVAKWQPQLT